MYKIHRTKEKCKCRLPLPPLPITMREGMFGAYRVDSHGKFKCHHCGTVTEYSEIVVREKSWIKKLLEKIFK